MSQQFLYQSKARSLSLMDICSLNDEQVFEVFKLARWKNGVVTCPFCNGSKHSFISTRKIWKCCDCKKQFSITSGTIFAYHKLPLKVYLLAITIYSNCAKGISALQLSRDLDVQYKTAFVLAHKIRESLVINRDNSQFTGIVEIDGCYTGFYIRPENKIENRKDRRKEEKPNKRCVLTIRQRGKDGADKTRTHIIQVENPNDIRAIALKYIAQGAQIHTDENSSYDNLHAYFDVKRVNHQKEYGGDNGESNNQAESFFSRFRRMQYGQVHKITPKYLDSYANEIAYREDTRRWANGKICQDITTKCMSTLGIVDWKGYWQGRHRIIERMGA